MRRPARRKILPALIALGAAALAPFATPAHASAFTPGNLLVCRVGDGSGSLVNTGSPMFLDEYTPAGALVQSIAVPTTTSGTNHRLILSGTATSECGLNLSADGQYVTFAGYDAAMPTASLAGTAAATTPRVVGRIDGNGTIDTSTALTDFATGNNPRAAYSTDGTSLWVVGGAGGVRTATLGGSTSTQISTTLTNLRQVAAFDGQLYVSTSSGSAVRIGSVGVGLPTTSGQTITNLPGYPTSGSPYAFQLVDLSASVAGVDTLYVAEDSNGGGQIQKWSLVGGSWVARGTISAAAVRGLTVSVSGGNVTLYATTGGSLAAGGGTIYSFTDTTGYDNVVSGTATNVATASANTAFRGISLVPLSPDPGTEVPEAPLSLLLPLTGAAIIGGTFVLTRRRSA